MLAIERNEVAAVHYGDGGIYRIGAAQPMLGGEGRCSRRQRCVERDPALMRPSDVPVVQGDATRIRAEIGWMPRLGIEQMLADTLDWWRREVRNGRSRP